MRAVRRVIRSAARRRVQTVVVAAVALLSTATVVLAVGLLVESDAPFDQAFARQAGAHAVATFDADLAGADALRTTAGAPGVSAAAGPFDAVSAGLAFGPRQIGSLTLVGRAQQTGPADRLAIDKGRWLTGPGQIVLARGYGGVPVGATVTVGVPGSPELTVVGVADSVTGTADAWVWPTQNNVLHAAGVPQTRQMLYRFNSAGTDGAVTASLTRATAALPANALLGSSSYLVVKRSADSSTAPVVPFVVAFAVLGLVMSVLIVSNVVNGAVVAGHRTIGVLKSLGFTPRQVVAVYTGQTLGPGLLGCVIGAVLGNVLAVPLLAQTARAYDVSSTRGVALWIDVLAVIGLAVTIAAAAAAPAQRAGRLSTVQAIGVGRTPRTGTGHQVRRALDAIPLPLALRAGLATPFARPARSAATLLAVLLGATVVVFAAGLSTSLHRVTADFTRTGQVPIDVNLAANGKGKGTGTQPGARDTTGTGAQPGGTGATLDPATADAAIHTQPGTAHVVGVTDLNVTLVGFNQPAELVAYHGDATWVGLRLITGRWYAAPGEAVAGSVLLRTTGHRVGDTVTLTTTSGRRHVHIVGESFDDTNGGVAMTIDAATLSGLTDRRSPDHFEVGLTPGTNVSRYADELSTALGTGAVVHLRATENTAQALAIMQALIGTITLLLCVVAALGVLNTVVLNTRERVHEIGVLKALGMTPGQVRAMVVTSMVGIGLVAGLLAIPTGSVLHHRILPAMAGAAGTAIPASVIDVYRPLELAALAGAGILLAVLGALLPAGWAAHTRAANALRSE